jgi:enoyl-CoA hydratase/carnithine racemase
VKTAENLDFEVKDGVGWLTLQRPEAKNAMTKAMYAGIRDVCRAVHVDDDIQALVLQGEGDAFAVGGDLKEILTMLDNGSDAEVVAYEDYLPFEAVRALPKPTIANISGLCMGGGLTLALMCDLRIASSDSRFAMPEAKVGIVDAHLPRTLRERVPAARLRYWLYTGATFSAQEAYDAGILTAVFEPEQMDGELARILGELERSSPKAIALLKYILTETWTLPGMVDANATLLGEDARTRIAAFASRSSTKK